MVEQVMAEDKATAEKLPLSCKEYGSGAETPVLESEPRSAHEHHNGVSINDSRENASPQHPVLHGDPVTISQCTFQAHIAR